MSEREYDLCYVIDPGLKIIEEGIKLAKECSINYEILENRLAEINKPEYAMKYGTEKYLQVAEEVKEKKAELYAVNMAKCNDMRDKLLKHIDDQVAITYEAFTADAAKNCLDMLNSNLVRHPEELARLWEDCNRNAVSRRAMGIYANKRGWDNVYIGSRYTRVMEVIETFLGHLFAAAQSTSKSYSMIWLTTYSGLENLAANLGVHEEFGIPAVDDANEMANRAKIAQLEFRLEVEERRKAEYVIIN